MLPRSFASLGFGSAFNQQTTIDVDFETSQFPVDTRYVGEMTWRRRQRRYEGDG